MVAGFTHIINVLFNLLVAPFGSNAAVALSVLSLACGVVMIFLFKATSDQERIRRVRELFKARILEMRIYQDDLVLIFRALGGALWTNLLYLRASLKPILVLLAFVLLIFIQLDERYGRAPLEPGDTTLLTVTLKEGADVMSVPVSLETKGEATVEAAPVRVPRRREINWRLRVDAAGTHDLGLKAYDSTYELPVTAGPTKKPLGNHRKANSALTQFLHPALPTIPGDSPIASVALTYPSARYPLFGWHAHWLVVFIVWSFIGALIPKFIFRIEI